MSSCLILTMEGNYHKKSLKVNMFAHTVVGEFPEDDTYSIHLKMAELGESEITYPHPALLGEGAGHQTPCICSNQSTTTLRGALPASHSSIKCHGASNEHNVRPGNKGGDTPPPPQKKK